jgi:hypothetical protein
MLKSKACLGALLILSATALASTEDAAADNAGGYVAITAPMSWTAIYAGVHTGARPR